eukprot:TRINITY_DN19251_c0_g1_i1.p1 TRINITY_DN19251_c0_g1~~TRINITY_DN19251_c0_g1_i1.p1  ORF type:complete len:942 (+),score=290.93 TRINITY_DN19251_c0_g1_i1:135-2960(+)
MAHLGAGALTLLEPSPQGYVPMAPHVLQTFKMGSAFTKNPLVKVYAVSKCKKVSRGNKRKDGWLVILDMIAVLCSAKGTEVDRMISLKDVAHISLVPHGQEYVAMLHSSGADAPIRVRLWDRGTATDALHPLRVLVWCKRRITFDSECFWSVATQQKVEEDYKAASTAGRKPTKKEQGVWKTKLVETRQAREANSPQKATSPAALARIDSKFPTMKDYAVEVRPGENLGIDFEHRGDVVVVRAVDAALPAGRAGVPNGLVVNMVNNVPVRTLDDVSDGLTRNQPSQTQPGCNVVHLRGEIGGPSLPPGSPTAAATQANGVAYFDNSSKNVNDDPAKKTDAEADRRKPSHAELRIEIPNDNAPPPPPSQPPRESVAPPPPPIVSVAQPAQPPSEATAARGQAMSGSGWGQAPSTMGSAAGGAGGMQHPVAGEPFSFECGGDTIDFIPEGSGVVGEYLNGIRVGTATRLLYHVEERKLVDQAGKGGPIPPADLENSFLPRLRAFCDANYLPIDLRPGGALVQFYTPSEKRELVRFEAGLGELTVTVNGVVEAAIKELRYNPVSGTVSDQDGGESAPIPEGYPRLDALRKLEKLCEGCEVKHNIDVAAAEKFETHRRAMDERVARAEAQLRTQDELRESELRDRHRQLDERERDVRHREEAAWHIQASPAGMYYTLKTMLEEEDPEARPIYRVLEDIPDAAFADELLGYFDEHNAGHFSRIIRSKLAPPAVAKVEALFRDVGAPLDRFGSSPRSHRLHPLRAPSFRSAALAVGPTMFGASTHHTTPVFNDDPIYGAAPSFASPGDEVYAGAGSARRPRSRSPYSPAPAHWPRPEPSPQSASFHTPHGRSPYRSLRGSVTPVRPPPARESSPYGKPWSVASPASTDDLGVPIGDWVDTLLSLEAAEPGSLDAAYFAGQATPSPHSDTPYHIVPSQVVQFGPSSYL